MSTQSAQVKLSSMVDMDSPVAVQKEVEQIILSMYETFDFGTIRKIFKDVEALFSGTYPGYRKCNTEYHDLKHTTDAVMAMIRLIHGAHISGHTFSRNLIQVAVAATLFHDTGYIQSKKDKRGTGAKYTKNHINRSIDFMDHYFQENGFTEQDFEDAANMLHCTGLNTHIDSLKFRNERVRLLSLMLGTADLLGQMADRTYLEKLLFLYYEFTEGNIPGVTTELSVLKNTVGFYEMTKKRFAEALGSVNTYMKKHFQTRWNLDRDLYIETIEANITYLKHIIEEHEDEYRHYLRRGELVKKLENLEKK